jgi:hypothetical protein
MNWKHRGTTTSIHATLEKSQLAPYVLKRFETPSTELEASPAIVTARKKQSDLGLAATLRKPSLLSSYLQTHLDRFEHWLWEWRVAINVSKSTVVLFAKTARRIQRPRPVQFFGEPIHWVETEKYLGVTLDTRLTWTAHVNQVGRQAA